MAEPLRVPPHNLEAERAVLGAALLDKDGLLYVTETLQAEDFYDVRHRRTFDVMAEMSSEGSPRRSFDLH